MSKKVIYEIRNSINDKVYVGSTKDCEDRKRTHFRKLRRGKHINQHLQSAFNLYGEGAMKFSILEEVEKEEELLIKEKEWMDKFLSYEKEFGYNLMKLEMGDLKYYSHSEETKKKISTVNKGKPSPLKGRKLSEEHRKNISEALKGVNTWTKGGVPWNKGVPCTEERKKKISSANKGKPSHWKGKKLSEEHKAKMSETRSGEGNPKAVMTWEKVREVRKRYKEGGITQKQLAEEYGVSNGCIKGILQNRTWKE